MFDAVSEMKMRNHQWLSGNNYDIISGKTNTRKPNSIIKQLDTPVKWENFLGDINHASNKFKEITGEPFVK